MFELKELARAVRGLAHADQTRLANDSLEWLQIVEPLARLDGLDRNGVFFRPRDKGLGSDDSRLARP